MGGKRIERAGSFMQPTILTDIEPDSPAYREEFFGPATGMVFVNHPTWITPDLPFGGVKQSGHGREISSLGIQKFVNKKLIRVASIDAPFLRSRT